MDRNCPEQPVYLLGVIGIEARQLQAQFSGQTWTSCGCLKQYDILNVKALTDEPNQLNTFEAFWTPNSNVKLSEQ